ncbi:hypothetical protein [Clostridium intestinale]|nr:hypothetical protein [Clostridium intestinale]
MDNLTHEQRKKNMKAIKVKANVFSEMHYGVRDIDIGKIIRS